MELSVPSLVSLHGNIVLKFSATVQTQALVFYTSSENWKKKKKVGFRNLWWKPDRKAKLKMNKHNKSKYGNKTQTGSYSLFFLPLVTPIEKR